MAAEQVAVNISKRILAMSVRWEIKFRSLRTDTLHTVKVYDNAYSGTPAQLVGAADPFVTQEIDDENMFLPVRTQSGYLRIADTGRDLVGNPFDWTDLIPDSTFDRPIELYAGEDNLVLKWQGYIKPETFDASYPSADVEVRSFPVECCLSALSSIDLTIVPESNISTFAGLLYTFFYNDLTANANVYFQGTNAVTDWLHVKLDQLVLEGKSQFDALNEICRFWGWTCRTDAGNIYFASADDSSQMEDGDWTRINVQDLREIEEGRDVTGTVVSFSDVTLGYDDFATINNSKRIFPGIREVTVTAEIGKVNDYPTIPFEYIKKQFATVAARQAASYGSESGTAVYLFQKGTNASGTQTYKDNDMTTVANPVNYGSLLYGGIFEVVDWYTGKLADKKNYDWTCRLLLIADSSYAPDPCLSIATDYAMTFPRGAIVISGTVYTEEVTVNGNTASYKTYTANGTMRCRLKVGNKYYTGGGVSPDMWSSTPSTFDIAIGNGETNETEGKGNIVTNRTYTTDYEPYTGHGCAILNDGELSGDVTFEIVQFNVNNAHGQAPAHLYVEDLRLSFVRRATDEAQGSETKNTYSQGGAPFPEKSEVNVVFASYNNNPQGRGLLTYNNAFLQSVPYEYEVLHQRPEEHLAIRMASFGSIRRRAYQLGLRADRTPLITPLAKVTTVDGVVTYPYSISRDWWNELTTTTLIEL